MKLGFGSSNIPKFLGSVHGWFSSVFIVILASHGFWLEFSFGDNSWSANLIDSKFAASIIIKTLDEWDIESLTFRIHKFTTEHFDDTANVFGSFISSEMNNELEILFVRVLLECNLLVKDELVIIGRGDFSCDGWIIELDVHFARELDFHGNWNDVQIVLVHLYLLLVVGHFVVNLLSFSSYIQLIFYWNLDILIKSNYLDLQHYFNIV